MRKFNIKAQIHKLYTLTTVGSVSYTHLTLPTT